MSDTKPGARPRRRMDRETTPGRCGNFDYCSIGMQRVLVQIPVSQPFVCPECGAPLRPPGFMGGTSKNMVLPALRITVLVLGMFLALVLGYLLGRVQPAVKTATTAASHEAAIKINTAREALGLKPVAIDSPKAAPPAPVESPLPPAPVAPLIVADRPYPAKARPVDVSAAPSHLQNESHFGQVTVDCELDAPHTTPICKIADRRGADAFTPAATDWLNSLAIQYVTPKDHRWRIIFQDFAGTRPHKAGE